MPDRDLRSENRTQPDAETGAGLPHRLPLSRRELLRLTGAAAFSPYPLVQITRTALLQQMPAIAGPFDLRTGQVVPPVPVVRPADLLVMELCWDNNLQYVVDGSGRAYLRRVNPAMPAYLILRFPPQHMGEVSYQGKTQPDGVVSHWLAGPSRLAFQVPAQLSLIQYRLEHILDLCQAWEMSVDCRAGGPPSCGMEGDPAWNATALEVPYGLVLSPIGPGTSGAPSGQNWMHSTGPVNRGGRIELWHTRLTTSSDSLALRAIHSYSDDVSGDLPIPQSADRGELVTYTENSKQWITANRLMLSSLGAWLDARYQYPDPNHLPQGASLSAWRHQMFMGRDQYVQVVREGSLIPFGHRAALVTTVERRFAKAGTAYLHREQYIVVREQEKTYFTDGGAKRPEDRQIPFRTIRILTAVTPPLYLEKPPQSRDDEEHFHDSPFWVKEDSTKQPFPFRISAVDREGQAVNFNAFLTFAAHGTDIKDIRPVYKMGMDAGWTAARIDGQKIAFVPRGAERDASMAHTAAAADTADSDPTLEVDSMEFDASDTLGGPHLASAKVYIPVVKQLSSSTEVPKPTTVRLADAYTKSGTDGFDPKSNPAQLFLQVAETPPAIFGKDNSPGGVVQLSQSLYGLSRSNGAVCGPSYIEPTRVPVKVSDTDDAINQFTSKGKFDPLTFFQGSQLLGAIDLARVIQGVDYNSEKAKSGETAPAFSVKPILGGNGLPIGVEALFRYTTGLQDDDQDDGVFIGHNIRGDKATLTIEHRIRKLFQDGPPTQETTGTLTDFQIDLIKKPSFITLAFAKLEFSSQNGEKPKITPQLSGVTFGQELQFLSQLARVLGDAGVKLNLDVKPEGIRAGFTLTKPLLNFGKFRFENISVAQSLFLPLNHVGVPLTFSFAFGERSKPFHAVYDIFAGGGYFQAEMGVQGLISLEASIEVGASVALDLGVASAKAEEMYGLVYSLIDKDGVKQVNFEGFQRISGAFNVLQIVTVSLMARVGLMWPEGSKELIGRAVFTVEANVLFLSHSVTFTYEKRFTGADFGIASASRSNFGVQQVSAGGSLPPAFKELILADDWKTYCAAFAA